MDTSEHASMPAEDVLAPADGHNADLPLTYGQPFVSLLPRDPRCVFAQWEIPDGLRRAAVASRTNGAGDAPNEDALAGELVLRLYDGGSGRDRFVDFPISQRHGMYIRLERPGLTLAARVGLRNRDGGFVPLVSSNVVRLPPGEPAAAGETWAVAFLEPGRRFGAMPAGSPLLPWPGPGTSSDLIRRPDDEGASSRGGADKERTP